MLREKKKTKKNGGQDGPTKLPRADRAIIPPEKLTDYLLSTTHPVGSAKARFFRGHGFNDDNPELLAEACS